MNKRHMDFVPNKSGKMPEVKTKQEVKPKSASKPAVKSVTKPVEKKVTKKATSKTIYSSMPALKEKPASKKDVPKVGYSTKVANYRPEPTLGTVEDVNVAKSYKIPNSPFINRTTIEKRPLSKNVYQKKVESVPAEQPKGPVTIITKPEKDAHVSIIVTIILTIILGAAAGTVAFLLLPK